MKLENFFDKYLGGHVSIGNITIYGHNAMHWACNIRTKKYGYICFRLPLPSFSNNRPFFKPLYLYFSPNATPSVIGGIITGIIAASSATTIAIIKIFF